MAPRPGATSTRSAPKAIVQLEIAAQRPRVRTVQPERGRDRADRGEHEVSLRRGVSMAFPQRCLARLIWAIGALIALALGLGTLPARAQSVQVVISDADRRIILVPGIEFTFQDTGKAHNACDRAIKETFPKIYDLLTSSKARAESRWYDVFAAHPEIPLYAANDIYAFDYSFDPAHESASPCNNNNVYAGSDIRERLADYSVFSSEPVERPPLSPFDPPPVLAPEQPPQSRTGSSTRFGIQFHAWLKACPNCQFDIIAHSLGGAVVASWIATQAGDDDLKHIHTLITIDSPINGSLGGDSLVGLIAIGVELFKSAAGRSAEDLRDDAFVNRMRTAPTKVDMLCLANIYDALIITHMATIRDNNVPSRVQYTELSRYKSITGRNISLFAGPCHNIAERFSKSNPYDFLANASSTDKLKNAASKAHTEPLGNENKKYIPTVIPFILNQLGSVPPRWSERNSAFDAIVEPITSPVVAPGAEATVELRLQNTGTYVWEANAVKLKLMESNQLHLRNDLSLPQRVAPGEELPLHLTIRASPNVGSYRGAFKLTYGTHEFGPPITFDLVVQPSTIPGTSGGGLDPQAAIRALWESLIAEIRRQLEELRRRIIEAVIREFFRQLCGAAPATVVLGTVVLFWRVRHRRANGESDDEC